VLSDNSTAYSEWAQTTSQTLSRTLDMAHPGFGHLWQQEETSDVEIIISVAEEKTSAGDEFPEARSSSCTFLQQFPGHSQILSLSPYLLAQASIMKPVLLLSCQHA
jgi:hypothetical protein